jgi:hypothetical protein
MGHALYRDKKVVGVFVVDFRALRFNHAAKEMYRYNKPQAEALQTVEVVAPVTFFKRKTD